MHYYTCLPNSTLPTVKFHEEGVKIQQIEAAMRVIDIIVKYIPSSDSVVCVLVRGLAGRA